VVLKLDVEDVISALRRRKRTLRAERPDGEHPHRFFFSERG
jgi:hypothetical protein